MAETIAVVLSCCVGSLAVATIKHGLFLLEREHRLRLAHEQVRYWRRVKLLTKHHKVWMPDRDHHLSHKEA